jgi:hypothetical protein
MFLLEFEQTRPDLDDRYKPLSQKDDSICDNKTDTNTLQITQYKQENRIENFINALCYCGKKDCLGSQGI